MKYNTRFHMHPLVEAMYNKRMHVESMAVLVPVPGLGARDRVSWNYHCQLWEVIIFQEKERMLMMKSDSLIACRRG